MPKGEKIGILSVENYKFASMLIDTINTSPKARGLSIFAEFIKIGEIEIKAPIQHRLVVDWASHQMPFYEEYLKYVVLNGGYVINNPFWRGLDSKFFQYALANKSEIRVPPAILLPPHEYEINLPSGALQNLVYPLLWEKIYETIGFPALLRPYQIDSPEAAIMINDLEHLLDVYHHTGTKMMILQQVLAYDHFVRSYTIGKKWVLSIKYDPYHYQYYVDHEHLSPELGRQINRACQKINQKLGYDINMIDFGIKDDKAYMIDVGNPVPEIHPDIITPFYFDELVERIAAMCIDYVLHPPKYQMMGHIPRFNYG